MKEQTILTSNEGQNFIDLSEKLRSCLESKLDELFQNHRFRLYFNKSHSFFAAPENDQQLIQSIIGIKNDNKLFAYSTCMAVKTWYSMYYDDRISVLEKFYSYSKRLSYQSDLLSTVDISFVFSKVLFMELAGILNEIRWRPIHRYYLQASL
jgi:hypothetical protein